MTTTQLLDHDTQWGKAGDVLTVYRGPCRDRRTLRDSAADGDLVFSVNRSHIFTPLGQPTVIGYYEDFADAVKELRKAGDGWRISAHARGCGCTEECLVFCSWFKPVGDLLAA